MVAFILLVDSKNIMVLVSFLSLLIKDCFRLFFLGKKPKNIKESAESPDKTIALVTDEGPGITVYPIFSSMHLLNK